MSTRNFYVYDGNKKIIRVYFKAKLKSFTCRVTKGHHTRAKTSMVAPTCIKTWKTRIESKTKQS